MTQRARQSQSSSKTAVHPVVLFGVDRHGKPTAARFPEGQRGSRPRLPSNYTCGC
jgi:hypothetical protein